MSDFPAREPPQTPHPHYSNTLLTPSHSWSTNFNSPSNTFTAYPASLSLTPVPQTLAPKPTISRKRNDKENSEPLQTPIPPPRKQKPKRELSTFEKLQKFYAYLKHELDWTYGELLFHTSQDFSGFDILPNQAPGNSNRLATREQMAAVMHHFFKGNGEHPPSEIISNWLKHPYGRLQRDSSLMYSTSVPYPSIKPVRPGLTSFAAQIVQNKLVQEAEKAIDVSNGLHVSISDSKTSAKKLEWTDIGSATVEHTQDIIRKHQPLTWSILMKLASRPPRSQNGVTIVRQKRPPELVCIFLKSQF
jgi:hypothetical protein